jgi:four helix bundle protein
MAKSHTHLTCWQLANELRQLIIKHTGDGTRAQKDLRFTSNLRDAIASVCRNQAEGFAKFKHKPQKPYFNHARSSLAEVQDCIEDGRQRGHFSDDLAREMTALCGRAAITNLRYLRSLDSADPPQQRRPSA